MRRVIAILLCLIAVSAQAARTGINNGILQSALDGGGKVIFNLGGLSVVPGITLHDGQWPQAVTTSQTITVASALVPPANWALNDIQVYDTAAFNGPFVSAFNIAHHLQTGYSHNTNSLQVQLFVDGLSGGLGGNNAAGYFGAEASSKFDAASIGSTYRGGLFGINPSVTLHSGATNWGFVGTEFNLAVETGATVKHKGFAFCYNATDAVKGLPFLDYLIGISSQNGSSARVGFQIGSQNGNQPISTAGDIMALVDVNPTTGAEQFTYPTVANGINFSKANVTDSVIKGRYSKLSDVSGIVAGAGPDAFAKLAPNGSSSQIGLMVVPKGIGGYFGVFGNVATVLPPSDNGGDYPTLAIGNNYSDGGGEQDFINTANNAGGFRFMQKTGAATKRDLMWIDKDDTAGNTSMLLWDVTAGTLKRVSVGAADSGGAGYKVLRVPN